MTTDTPADLARLEARVRSARRLAVAALLFGLGVGFYGGFAFGVDTARSVIRSGADTPAAAPAGE